MFNTIESYMGEYALSHQNPVNKKIHYVCVPIILFSSMGILKALPVPASFPLFLDISTILTALVLFFYAFLKNIRVFILMSVVLLINHLILEYMRPRFFLISLGLFILAWIAQFIGHKIEGKKPSFFRDFFYLLIGPIWVLKDACEVLGFDLKISTCSPVSNAKET